MNEIVVKLKQRGSVYLWKFPKEVRKFPGWNITADDQGCSFLIELLSEMKSKPFSAEYRLNLSESTQVAMVNGVDSEYNFAKTLLLKYKTKHPIVHWQLTERSSNVILEFGSKGIDDIIRAAEDIRVNKGDYTIGNETSEASLIWIWWKL